LLSAVAGALDAGRSCGCANFRSRNKFPSENRSGWSTRWIIECLPTWWRFPSPAESSSERHPHCASRGSRSQAVLKEGGRGASVGGHGRRLADLLVVAEMALAIVLLVGAGLMIRSFLTIYKAPLGLGTTNLLTMRLALPDSTYPKPTDQIAFHDRLKSRLESIPGVELVAIANFLPTGGSLSFPYELEGVAPPDTAHRPSASTVVISQTTSAHWTLDSRRPCLQRIRRPIRPTGRNREPQLCCKGLAAGRSHRKALATIDGGAPGAWHTVSGWLPTFFRTTSARDRLTR